MTTDVTVLNETTPPFCTDTYCKQNEWAKYAENLKKISEATVVRRPRTSTGCERAQNYAGCKVYDAELSAHRNETETVLKLFCFDFANEQASKQSVYTSDLWPAIKKQRIEKHVDFYAVYGDLSNWKL